MAENNYGSGANIQNVSSSSIVLFAAEGTMLRVGFQNEILFLSIVPKVIDESGRARWPKEMGQYANIRPQQAAALYNGICKKIIPCIAAKEDYDGYGAVPLNRDCTTLAAFGYRDNTVTFDIFKNVNADRTCKDHYHFSFDKVACIDHYNPQTGMYEVYESQGQFYVIMELLNMVALHMSGTIGHSAKNAQSFNTNQIISHVRAIANKVGAVPTSYGNYSGDYGSGYRSGMEGETGATKWQSGATESYTTQQTRPPEVQQLSNLDGLMG